MALPRPAHLRVTLAVRRFIFKASDALLSQGQVMNCSPKTSRIPVLLALTCLVLGSIACGFPVLPAPTPTPTLPAEVDSALRDPLLGQWRVINGGPWEGATLTFDADGSFTVVGGTQENDDRGSFYFTAEQYIVFTFPDYDGSAYINFITDNQLAFTSTPSNEPFGVIYTLERVK
jgi:hypothetical protein